MASVAMHRPARRVVGLLMAAALLVGACGGGGGGEEPAGFGPQCQVAADCASLLEQMAYEPPCTDVACEEERCVFSGAAHEGEACDDGDACTSEDACDARRCVGAPRDCDDGDFCTADSCDPATGACGHTVDPGALCNDAIACTHTDRCGEDGVCRGQPGEACECLEDADCADLSVNLCEGAPRCGEGYACEVDPAGAVTCDDTDDTDDTACLASTCDPETGTCAPAARSEGEPCGLEDDPCVEAGTCQEGLCVGAPPDCDDGNPCTEDLCDAEQGGCVHPPAEGPCDDADPCTTADACLGDGTCVGVAVDCDDGNACTDDVCDAETGVCQHTASEGTCDDGDPCTVDDLCAGTTCEGAPMACDDGEPCTLDACEVADGEGVCVHAPAAGTCDDGDPCTVGDACAEGTCAPGEDVCACHEDADCDDEEAADACVGDLVCDTSAVPWTCEPLPGTPVACEAPANPCEESHCAPATGDCVVTFRQDGTACDDGDPCTEVGACEGGRCVREPAVTCDDGDPCTADLCEDGGCAFEPLTGAETFLAADFDDGLPAGWEVDTDDPAAAAWTTSAVFAAGDGGQGLVVTGEGLAYDGPARATLRTPEVVVVGEEVRLRFVSVASLVDPGCAADRLTLAIESYGEITVLHQICSPEADWTLHEIDLAAWRGRPVRLLLTFESNATLNGGFGVALDDLEILGDYVCDDGDPCTVGDLCAAGACGGEARTCDDGDPCTGDACEAGTGLCVHEDLPACACESAAACADAGPCVQTTCEDGFCVDTPVTGPCDDGDPCTTGDTCGAGGCAGTPLACDDGDPCTADLCDPEDGCVHPLDDGASCDDGDPCTVEDACVGGACAGAPMDCSQPNPCASGACVSGECVVSPLDDGQPVLLERFDSVAPGALPAGWASDAGGADYAWQADTDGASSAPNALAALPGGAGGYPALTVTAAAPAVTLPPAGGALRYLVRSSFAAPGCEADVLAVTVDGQEVDMVCASTDGFEERVVDLTPWGGQEIAVALALTLDGGVAGDVDVRVDDLAVIGAWPCDDGDACTTADSCVVGACQGEPVEGCP